MTNEEAINTLKSLKSYYNDNSEYCEDGYVGFDNEDNEALDLAIKALEQQPCEDCISQQAVLDKKELVELEDGQSFYCINPKDVETLPSVTPSISKGEWLHIYKSGIACECSRCHIQMPITEYYHFCPNCGADMRESEERVCMELKLDKKFIDEAVQEAVKDIKQNYISKDVLDKIRAEIIQMDFDFGDFYDHTDTIKEMVVEVIDKYKAESEDKK